MYKFITLLALIACAMAEPKPGYLATPAVAVAHTVPLATSYSNSYQVALKKPIVAAVPTYAYAAHAAPVAYAAAPAHVTYAAHAAPVYTAHGAQVAYGVHGAQLTYAAAPALKYY